MRTYLHFFTLCIFLLSSFVGYSHPLHHQALNRTFNHESERSFQLVFSKKQQRKQKRQFKKKLKKEIRQFIKQMKKNGVKKFLFFLLLTVAMCALMVLIFMFMGGPFGSMTLTKSSVIKILSVCIVGMTCLILFFKWLAPKM